MWYYCYGTQRQSCLPLADSLVLKFKLQVKNWVQLRFLSLRWVLQQAQLSWTFQLCLIIGSSWFWMCLLFSKDIHFISMHLYLNTEKPKSAVSHVAFEFIKCSLKNGCLFLPSFACTSQKWCCWETCSCTQQKINSLWNLETLCLS